MNKPEAFGKALVRLIWPHTSNQMKQLSYWHNLWTIYYSDVKQRLNSLFCPLVVCQQFASHSHNAKQTCTEQLFLRTTQTKQLLCTHRCCRILEAKRSGVRHARPLELVNLPKNCYGAMVNARPVHGHCKSIVAVAPVIALHTLQTRA